VKKGGQDRSLKKSAETVREQLSQGFLHKGRRRRRRFGLRGGMLPLGWKLRKKGKGGREKGLKGGFKGKQSSGKGKMGYATVPPGKIEG